MKILVVTSLFPPRYSGAVIQTISLCKELAKQDVDVAIVTNNFEDKTTVENYEGLRVYKYSTFPESSRLSQLGGMIFAAKILMLSIWSNYQVVFFSNFIGYATWIFPILKLLKKKIVLELVLVGSDDPQTLKKRKLGFVFFLALRCMDRIVPISSRLKELSIEAGIKREKLDLIPTGADIKKFSRLSSEQRLVLKKALGYFDRDYVFLAVGQVEVRKGYEFMLKAWKHINKKFPNAILLIAGPKNDASNAYYQKLLYLMKTEEVGNIRFLGFVKNVDELMKISDCLLHCALNEGLPNTLLEASIASVPIVCRKIDGITSDIILNSNIGRECSADDPQDFAKLVFSILRERDLDQVDFDCEELKKRFGMDQVASKYIIMFEKLLFK